MSKPISKQAKKCDLYSSQLRHSRKRGHPKPEYTRQEFYDWLDTQPKFDRLYNEWVEKGFNKDFAPSVDRIRNNEHYKLDNLQILTWEENKLKGYLENRLKNIKPIEQYTVGGIFIKDWYSLTNAAKKLNISRHLIKECADGKKLTTGGFQWKYKNSSKVIKDVSDLVNQFSFSANPVYQMDMENNVLKEYPSFTAASNDIGDSGKKTGKIRKCCEGKIKTYKGFKWRYVDNRLNQECLNYLKEKADKKVVEQYDINGDYLNTFSSPAEIRHKLGIQVTDACKLTNSLIGGYQWKYKHSNKEIKPYVDHNKENQKPVLQLTKDGQLIKEFESAREAAESINKPIKQLRKRLQGERSPSYVGFIWKYK